ncbi:hypothetical protein J6590_032834 [Homalodisca vitripennis]|nr:hypothetical protein J6590_032834 [Homalodisca vitripennis]
MYLVRYSSDVRSGTRRFAYGGEVTGERRATAACRQRASKGHHRPTVLEVTDLGGAHALTSRMRGVVGAALCGKAVGGERRAPARHT